MIAKGLLSTRHPILAHIIPMRRCNLSCAYCNEYDQTSNPVPIEALRHRLDLLANLGTTIVTISGGEPLLHPELDDVISHVRRRGIIAGLITNGYLLTAGANQAAQPCRPRPHADQRSTTSSPTRSPRKA
jgi:MoaA/NifB/PqqE/SkfB family radical SAM enzyme